MHKAGGGAAFDAVDEHLGPAVQLAGADGGQAADEKVAGQEGEL